jgi:molecular chaperone GrpE (heat shock protein)
MDNYLIDRETLGRFVDELIKSKTLSVSSTEELNIKREEAIKTLDEKIGLAIFRKFTPEQNTEFNQLLDREDTTEATFENFFQKTGLNIEKIANDALAEFAKEFLGDQNA